VSISSPCRRFTYFQLLFLAQAYHVDTVLADSINAIPRGTMVPLNRCVCLGCIVFEGVHHGVCVRISTTAKTAGVPWFEGVCSCQSEKNAGTKEGLNGMKHWHMRRKCSLKCSISLSRGSSCYQRKCGAGVLDSRGKPAASPDAAKTASEARGGPSRKLGEDYGPKATLHATARFRWLRPSCRSYMPCCRCDDFILSSSSPRRFDLRGKTPLLSKLSHKIDISKHATRDSLSPRLQRQVACDLHAQHCTLKLCLGATCVQSPL